MKDILEQKGDVNKLKENNHYDKKGKIKFASVEYVNTLSGKYSMNMENEIAAVEKKQNIDNYHICDSCKKSFPKKQALMSHLKIHDSKLRIFKCSHDLCTKSFYRKDNLNSHMNIHTGLRPHKCRKKCKKGFNDRKTRNQHEKRNIC